jgi:hypothetical protein
MKGSEILFLGDTDNEFWSCTYFIIIIIIIIIITFVKGKGEVCLSVFQHLFLEGVLYSYPNEFLHSSPESLHTKRRERPLSVKEGTVSEFS